MLASFMSVKQVKMTSFTNCLEQLSLAWWFASHFFKRIRPRSQWV